ncbi:putative signal peptidase complex subunit 2 [Capsicum annuum]|nr:putative signal peptidase complex subunit 2 [Capsicum annuum]
MASTTTATETTTKKNPKKTNLLDHHSIKNLLDESVNEIVKSKGYPEDVRLSNVRLLIGSIIIAIALVAQFYKKEFPANRDFLIGCIFLLWRRGYVKVLLEETCDFVGKGDQRGGGEEWTWDKKDYKFASLAFSGSQTPLCGNILARGFFSRSHHEYHLHRFLLSLVFWCLEALSAIYATNYLGSFNSTGLIVSSKLPRFSDLYTLTIESADPKSISARPKVEFTKSVTKWFAKDGVLVEGLFWKDVEGLLNDYAKEPKKSK